jgi:hypothetical protein
MKISDSTSIRSNSAVQRPSATRPAARPGDTPAVRSVADTTEVMGIPESEFTPKVREAIMKLMAEIDTLSLRLFFMTNVLLITIS